MHSRPIALACLALALTGAGCALDHTADPPSPEAPSPEVHALPPASPVAPRVDLDACLGAGGSLVELGSVNNNDAADHGALLTFGISPSGLVAAAGEDGTLKFWTMGASLVGVADGSALTYGSEVGASPITDLVFMQRAAIVGDVRGLVSQMTPEGGFGVLGGTTPDVPIISVAFDEGAGRLAHAQGGATAPGVVPLVVAALDGSMHADIGATLPEVTDLAFTTDGELLVGGSDGARAALEIRSALDPSTVVARPDVGGDARVVEVAAAREGTTSVALTNGHVAVLDSGAVDVAVSAAISRTLVAPMRSVDLTPSGAFVVSIGEDGTLRVHDTRDGRQLAEWSLASPVGVRVDATGERIVVGASSADLHVLACRAR